MEVQFYDQLTVPKLGERRERYHNWSPGKITREVVITDLAEDIVKNYNMIRQDLEPIEQAVEEMFRRAIFSTESDRPGLLRTVDEVHWTLIGSQKQSSLSTEMWVLRCLHGTLLLVKVANEQPDITTSSYVKIENKLTTKFFN